MSGQAQDDEVLELRRELAAQRRWIDALSEALLMHARTDVAPDAALPALERLRREIVSQRPDTKRPGIARCVPGKRTR